MPSTTRTTTLMEGIQFVWICCAYLFSLVSFGEDLSISQDSFQSNSILNYSIEELEQNARNQPKETIKQAKELLNNINQAEQTGYYTDLLNVLSYAEYMSVNYTDAMQYAKQAEKLANEKELPRQKARAFVLQGNILQEIGLYRNAIGFYQKSVSIYREKKLSSQLSRALTNIGNTYFSAQRYDAALDFYHESLKVSEKPIEKAPNFLGIGNVLGQQNYHLKSIASFEKASDFYHQANDALGTELSLSGLAYQYTQLEQYAKAIKLLNTAIASAKSADRYLRMMSMELSLAYAESMSGNEKIALQRIDSVMERAKQINNNVIQSAAFKYLYRIYRHLGDYYKALDAFEQSQTFKEQAKKTQNEYQLSALQSILQLEQKNLHISELTSQNQLQQLKIQQQKTQTFAISATLLFISMLLIWHFHRRYQRKLLNRQIAINSRLEELNTLKTQLLANTSHELRTPLNGISGMSQLLLDNPEEPLSPSQSEMVGVIEQSSARLLRLIEDLLDLSQLQAKRMTVQIEEIEINQIINKVISQLKPLAQEKGLQIIGETPLESLFVFADCKRLEQILINLVGNAIKFSEKGNITIKVSIVDQQAEIRVIDQGQGIPLDKLNSIFDPFTQVDAGSNRKQQGSGLGLSITKELVLLHDSHLNVKSIPAQGSEFFFKLNTSENYQSAIDAK